jgi:hypothetical protein
MNPTTISLAIVTPLSLRGVLVVTVETKACDFVSIAGRKCRRHSPGANRRAGLLELACTGIERLADHRAEALVCADKNPRKSKFKKNGFEKLEFKKRFGSESKNTPGREPK